MIQSFRILILSLSAICALAACGGAIDDEDQTGSELRSETYGEEESACETCTEDWIEGGGPCSYPGTVFYTRQVCCWDGCTAYPWEQVCVDPALGTPPGSRPVCR